MLKRIMTSLKTQIIIGLVLGVSVLVLSIVWIFSQILKENLQISVAKDKKAIEMNYEDRLSQRIGLLNRSLEMIMGNKTVMRAFSERDRDALISELLEDYETKLKKQGILQFQFHTTDNHSFLRLEEASKFGDDLSFKQTVVRCNATKKQITGLEIGKFGPGIRIVYPVIINEIHYGSIEFGVELEGLLKSIAEEFNVDYSIGLKTDLVKNAEFKKQETDKEIGEYIFIYEPTEDLQEIIAKYPPSDSIHIVERNGKMFSFFYIPMKDFDGKQIGYIVINEDLTAVYESKYSSLRKVGIFTTVFVGIFLLLAALWITRNITTPISKSANFATDIKNGNFDATILVKSRNEIGQLAEALLAMKTNLLQMFDEVRKLAERTIKATKEIGEMIVEIQKESAQANNSVDSANESVNVGKIKTEEVEIALNEILGGTEKVENEIAQLATASEEESSTAREIAHNMEVINNVAQETASGIHQIAHASEDLMRLTENLKDMISSFKIGRDVDVKRKLKTNELKLKK